MESMDIGAVARSCRPLLIASFRYLLTLFRLGGGGLFEPPLRQNRDNSYIETAMTFKFSDFS